jgi:ribosome maturation factor RimP
MSIVERVRDLVAPVLEADGLELFDVEYGGGRVVVLADRPGGVDLDALTQATHHISALLDREDPIPGRYVLEVSSPGLERPLRTAAHFRRFVGSTVSIKTKPDVEGERRIRGLLSEADDEGCVVDGRRFAYTDIERARTVFEWGPSPRPAPKRTKGSAKRRNTQARSSSTATDQEVAR